MEILANDDRLGFNTLAPAPPAVLVSQSVVDVTTLCAHADYLVARCPAHLSKEHNIGFSAINDAVCVRPLASVASKRYFLAYFARPPIYYFLEITRLLERNA